MKDKISTVKNPLTVIAIFAGTAEISGTAILPLLGAESQQTYIWFLMLFPLLLIIFFFLTLNWNHKVLYAPSDFTNEDNFVNILQKPSIQETLSKIESDLVDNEDSSIENTTENESDKKIIDNHSEKNTENVSNSSKVNRKKDAILVRDISRKRMQEAQMAELLVLNKLEQELNIPIQREMMIKIGASKIIFDGVVQIGSSLTGIEVKYVRNKNTFNSSIWNNLFNRFELLYRSLDDLQKKSFSIIFAIVTDENPIEIKQYIDSRMIRPSFPIDIRVYDFDELRN